MPRWLGEAKVDGSDDGKVWQEYVIASGRASLQDCFQFNKSLFTYMPLTEWWEDLAMGDSNVAKQVRRAHDVAAGMVPALDVEDVTMLHQTGSRVFTPIITFTAHG